ncbi:MAG: TAXI family TRAP transporter solute-binding subunit [Caulobacterales bacterium]
MSRKMRMILLAAFILTVLVFAAVCFWVAQPPDTIRLSAGRAGGAHGLAGEKIKKILARSGVKVELVQVRGTEEKLRRLTVAGPEAIDAAIVQSGYPGAATRKGVTNLGAIYLEPIWIFGRDLPPGDDIRRIKGLRLAASANASKSSGLAGTLLAENGITEKDITIVPLNSEGAVKAVLKGDVDAAWLVGSVGSTWVQQLLESPDLELVSFDRAAAYARRHSFLVDTMLAKGAIDLGKNVPGHDIKLVGPTAELIIHDKMHPALQSLLLDAMREAFADGDAISAPGMFPNKDLIDIPLSQEARRYYASGPTFFRRVLPYWAANFAERAIFFLIPLLTLMVPLAQSVPPFLNWRIKRRINVWYHQLRLLESRGLGAKDSDEHNYVCNKLEDLIEQVGDLKVPVDFADDAYRLRVHMRFVLDSLQRRGPIAARAPA